jgi:opacity protein-like surface antigen
MRSIKVFAIAAAVLAAAQAAEAQTPQFVLEARGGFALPTGEWNDDDILENGFGFGGNVKAMVTPMVGVYAGWETYSFGIEGDDEEDVDADATDAGFRAGLALTLPMASLPSITPFVEAGAIYNTLEIGASDEGTSVEIESDAGIGFEAGIGLSAALGPNLSVTPSVRYRSHDASFDEFADFDDDSVTVSYIVFGIGLAFRL